MLTKPFLSITQFAILFSILFLSACTDMVQDEFEPYGPFPAVTGFLHADSVISVRVSLMKELGDEPLPLIENALVLLTTNGNAVDTLQYNEGRYYSNRVAQPNTGYYIKVKLDGFDTVTATCKTPHLPHIVSVERVNAAGLNYDSDPYAAISLTFNNLADTIAYFEVLIRDAKYNEWFYNQIVTDPILLFEGYAREYYGTSVVFSNTYIEGDTYTLKINCSQSGGYEPVVVYLKAVSESYYRYQKSWLAYDDGLYTEMDISGYAQHNLYSNISGGIGIFAGASTVITDTIFPTDVALSK